MARFHAVLLFLLVAVSLTAQHQYAVRFAHGTELFPANFKEKSSQSPGAAEITDGYYARYIQFETIPDATQRKEMEALGVQFVGYVQYGCYLTLLPAQLTLSDLSRFAPRSIMPMVPSWKMHQNLTERPFGAWAIHGNQVDINVQVLPHINIANGAERCRTAGLQVISEGTQNGQLTLRIDQERIAEVAALPFIKYLELLPPPGEKEDINGRSLHRANLLDSDHPLGKKYNGAGVNALVRDDGAVGPHIDFAGRLHNVEGVGPALPGTHGDGVAGVIGAAGNIDPTKKGMAAGADIYVIDYVNSFQDNTLSLHLQEHITVTNTSYSDGCNIGYTLATQTVDQQLYEHPALMHVFSAGNSNGQSCNYGAGSQWGNITGGHKMAKNAIATANLRANGVIETSSSRGPAFDGRMKPDIAAHGTDQNSTDPNNSYQVFGGTSAASPGIAGCIAQLMQAYRQLNNDEDAPGALLKLALLTTANEMGNVGPDYIFGWGHVNNYRALQLLEDGRYGAGTIEQASTTTHTIQIPTGVKQARLMIYWAEQPSEENTSRALINDLDLTVLDASGTIYQPWLLNPTPNPTILNTPAGRGRDSLNNMEQVAIENPAPGAYTFTIHGFEVPLGPQDYYYAWEFDTDDIQLTFPAGGEGFAPGKQEWLRWDAYGNTTDFELRYSTDDGQNWLPIATTTANQRMFQWTIPNTVSNRVRVMVVRENQSDISDYPFTIAPIPTSLAVEKVCPDGITLTWENPVDTLEHDVYLLGQKYMEIKGHTAGNAFTIPVLNPETEQWIAVRSAFADGQGGGQRALAIRWNGGLSNCQQTSDLEIQQLIAPDEKGLISCGPVTQYITVRVKNEGATLGTGATIHYSVNNGADIAEPLADIAVGGFVEHTFATPVSFVQNGSFDLLIWTSYTSDNYHANDTLSRTIPITVQMESALFTETFQPAQGLPAGWTIDNPDNSLTWGLTNASVTGSDGLPTKAIMMDCYNYTPGEQQEDYLYMVPLDLSILISPGLSFYVAHAQFPGGADALRLEAFPDCDLSAAPIVVWEKTDPELSTVGTLSSRFMPDEGSDWRYEIVSLTQFAGQSVILRFASVNGYSNTILLDNIGLIKYEPSFPEALFTMPDTVCRATITTITGTASPGIPASYTWSFGSGAQPSTATGIGPHEINFLTPGNRTIRLIATNSFGSDTTTKLIHVRAFPTPNFNVTTDDLTVNFNNTSVNASSYSWDFGDGTPAATVASPVHVYTNPGTYTAVLTAINPCKTVTKSLAVTLTVGSVEQTGLQAIRIAPNPTSGDFRVEIEHSAGAVLAQFDLRDAAGRLVYHLENQRIESGSTIIPFNGLQLPKGAYQLRITTPKGTTAMTVVVQ